MPPSTRGPLVRCVGVWTLEAIVLSCARLIGREAVLALLLAWACALGACGDDASCVAKSLGFVPPAYAFEEEGAAETGESWRDGRRAGTIILKNISHEGDKLDFIVRASLASAEWGSRTYDMDVAPRNAVTFDMPPATWEVTLTWARSELTFHTVTNDDPGCETLEVGP